MSDTQASRTDRYAALGDTVTEAGRVQLMNTIGEHGGWQLDRRCRLHNDLRCDERVRAWAALSEVGLLDPIDEDPTAVVARKTE